MASVEDATPIPLFDTADIQAAIGEERGITLQFALSNRNNPPKVFALAYVEVTSGPPQTYLIGYDLEAGALSPALSIEDSGISNPPFLSPDGRWLVADVANWTSAVAYSMNTLYVLDTFSGGVQAFSTYASSSISYRAVWSADSRWLLVADGDVLRFILPDHGGYERLVFPPTGGCWHAAWVRR
jgi:hypothetical protein